MKKTYQPEVIYYKDELGDEFSRAVITPRAIDEKYRYRRDRGFGKLLCFFWYRMVAIPLATVYLKLKFRHKIIGREKLKLHAKEGVFVYGNHTQPTADALIPTFISYPRWAHVVVHPNNVSMPILGRITPYMGALPLPDGLAAARNFTRAVSSCIEDGRPVFIYPEAHIWPYYTGIRPFTDNSFAYPVRCGAPVYCFTNTYKKRRSPKRARIITYVDGPFYPDGGLSPAAARRRLRDEVLECMERRAALSDRVLVEYRSMTENKGQKND